MNIFKDVFRKQKEKDILHNKDTIIICLPSYDYFVKNLDKCGIFVRTKSFR